MNEKKIHAGFHNEIICSSYCHFCYIKYKERKKVQFRYFFLSCGQKIEEKEEEKLQFRFFPRSCGHKWEEGRKTKVQS